MRIVPLMRIPDDRGPVWRMLREDDPHFERFGEIYFSAVNAGAVKAWRRHTVMTINCAVPVGRVLIVLYDDRLESPTRGALMEVMSGEEAYALITVPPGVWNGFKGMSDAMSLVANCATMPHDPAEIQRCDPDDPRVPYTWRD